MAIWTISAAPDNDGWDHVITDEHGAETARAWDGNPLASDPPSASGSIACLRSGWVGGEGHPEDGVFTSSFETWAKAGAERFGERWPEVAARYERIWVWPHARHVLSDTQSIFTNVRDDGGPLAGAGVLLEPTALLTASMIEAAEDHLMRTADTLFDHVRTEAVIVSNAVVVEPADGAAVGPSGPAMRPAPAHAGVVPVELLRRLTRMALDAGKPVVLYGDNVEAQRATLAV
ncbi:MAG: hypothetical protein CMJ31_04310 [Phycisphaerae bacterium]|nr:hypothetical protein [Phycisphaerae bacterium]